MVHAYVEQCGITLMHYYLLRVPPHRVENFPPGFKEELETYLVNEFSSTGEPQVDLVTWRLRFDHRVALVGEEAKVVFYLSVI